MEEKNGEEERRGKNRGIMGEEWRENNGGGRIEGEEWKREELRGKKR